MDRALRPEYVVVPLLDQFTNPFSLERAVRWSHRVIYASRGSHACADTACSCQWTVWPEGLPDDWIAVPASVLRFGVDVRGPLLARPPEVDAALHAAGEHSFAHTRRLTCAFERWEGADYARYEASWETSADRRRDAGLRVTRTVPGGRTEACDDEATLPIEVREKLRLLRAVLAPT
jgi:hypothetical protein